MNREELIEEAAKAMWRSNRPSSLNEHQWDATWDTSVYAYKALSRAALAVFDQAHTAEQCEVEWEYGATNVDDTRPVSIRDTITEAREAQEFYTREWGWRMRLLMRTKAIPAGPWVPVNESGSSA